MSKCIVLLCVFVLSAVDGYEWQTEWLDNVPIDHFAFADNRTFSLRYLINQQSWQPAAPIFFYCGNEGDIELFANNTGLMWDLAPRFKAMVVFAEHRYYGQTMPFGNQSFTALHNVGYLTSTQALADYALLLTQLRANIQGASDSPIIAFGGSYGGMLAAWMRIKYPHIIEGALAASAPVIQFTGYTPCWVYNSIVTRTFQNSGHNCAQSIKAVWPAIRRLAATQSGRTSVNDVMHVCANSALHKAQDADGLINWLTNALSELPMIDYPYASSFLAPVPAYPVKEACKYLTNASVSDVQLVSALHAAMGVYQNYTGQTQCYDTKADTAPDLGTQGWSFQACSEMVMPMCSNGTDMFEQKVWSPQQFAHDCEKQWPGLVPRANWAMIDYGADHLKYASNIIFSNGELDPWSGGGIVSLPFAHPSIYLVHIANGAHHYDLRANNKHDTKEILLVRQRHAKIIQKWVLAAKRRLFYEKILAIKTDKQKTEF